VSFFCTKNTFPKLPLPMTFLIWKSASETLVSPFFAKLGLLWNEAKSSSTSDAEELAVDADFMELAELSKGS
jgi:hypothetical protein